MNHFINVGFGNYVNADKIIEITGFTAAPIKRMVQIAKDEGKAIDSTCGRKTKSVIIMETGQIIISAILPDTITSRVIGKEMVENNVKDTKEDDYE